jgi:cell fate (sporulation/competence/biofilm development) regulator YlbF (YheA/YmcA/DUF963 family)
MPVDTNQIMQEAEKLGQLVSQHPAIARYKQAQKAVAEDPEAGRLLADFDRQIEGLSRQQESGMPITDAQQAQIEALQSRIVSHIKIKAMTMAQMELVDLLRKISQIIRRPLGEAQSPAAGAAPAQAPAGNPGMRIVQ